MKKKLTLARSTVRNLTSTDLRAVAGGVLPSKVDNCAALFPTTIPVSVVHCAVAP